MDNGSEDDLDPAVVERVRRDLTELGSDEASAPDVPPEVTERVLAALRAEPAHTVARAPLRRLQVIGLVVGLGAAVAAVIVGAVMVNRPEPPTFPAGPTAKTITVERSTAIPLPRPQIIELLSRTPDYGPLTDPGAAAPASRDWATHRGPRCWAPGHWTCGDSPGYCCCFPASHPTMSWPSWSSRDAAGLTPACWRSPWSVGRNLSTRPGGNTHA